MSFENIVGYDSVKKELLKVLDMIKNRERYEALGAKLTRNILLYGDPGIGKSLFARSFIDESGLRTFTVRRKHSTADFIREMGLTFTTAKERSPSIVLLDDMDKFANDDDFHCDSEEFVALQTWIDDLRDKDVFIIATANNIHKLPKSLRRAGRFDKVISLSVPNDTDARNIIKYYLSNKPIADSVNLDDFSKMITYSSCAELESIINEAAINAVYAGKDSIDTDSLVNAALHTNYELDEDDFTVQDDENTRSIAIHEAGHAVISDILYPGSVGIVSLIGNFTRRCRVINRGSRLAVINLAGKAAGEIYENGSARGCASDLDKTIEILRSNCNIAAYGFEFIDSRESSVPQISESMNARCEAVVHAELERCYRKASNLLLRNREYLDKVIKELLEKKYLLNSDIRRIRESVEITEIAV